MDLAHTVAFQEFILHPCTMCECVSYLAITQGRKMQTPDDHTPQSDVRQIDIPQTGAIAVQDLRKSFGTLEVLKGVSINVAKGGVMAIIGGSGSGKSTLLRCINFLETPTSGKISFDGETVRTKPDGTAADRRQIERLRSKLGMVFQSFNLWSHLTLLENVIEAPVHVLGQPRKQAVARAMELLERVGLAAKADQYPARLSGGQQQRGAIARVLAIDPTAMLFDEPTSALDPELVGEVLKVIRDLASEGRTMLLVTHEMRFAREVADTVIFLHKGVITEQGPPEALFENPQTERLQQFLRSVT